MTNAQPPILELAVLNTGLLIEDIQFSQLVHATIKYSSAKIICYDKDGSGIWRFKESLGIIPGFAGKNGISSFKKEGDWCTPSGLFRLEYAFGNKEKPETKITYRKITPHSYWVDDPKSAHYNQWVENNGNAAWTNAEHLCHYRDSYAYAVVIAYNTAPISHEKGSAIFLHCGDKPTSGCIAAPEQFLLKILRWLDPDKSPGILITGDIAYTLSTTHLAQQHTDDPR